MRGDRSDVTGRRRLAPFTVSVVTDAAGFRAAKEAAAAVSDALVDAARAGAGRLAALNFTGRGRGARTAATCAGST